MICACLLTLGVRTISVPAGTVGIRLIPSSLKRVHGRECYQKACGSPPETSHSYMDLSFELTSSLDVTEAEWLAEKQTAHTGEQESKGCYWLLAEGARMVQYPDQVFLPMVLVVHLAQSFEP